jgi:lysophospholipase L1-like esterase
MLPYESRPQHLLFAIPMSKPRSRVRTLLVIVGVLVALSVPAYIELFIRRPVGSGPAGPAVDRAAMAAVWTDRPVMLLGIGDSVTRGLGAKSAKHSYFQRLLINPPDEWDDMVGLCLSAVLPNLSSDNRSVSGTTSLEHARVIEDRLEHYPAEVFGLVVMTTGGNDLIHSYGQRPPVEGAMYGATLQQAQPWIKNFRHRLNQMLNGITDRFPGGCEIYLADIYDPTDGVGDAASIFLPRWNDGLAIHASYNATIRQVAADFPHVHVVPLHQTFLGHGSHCRQFWRATYDANDPHYWFYINIEDPNDRGYDAIRRVFLNTIIRNSSLAAPQIASTSVSSRPRM